MPETPEQLRISPEVRAEALRKAGEARRRRADFLASVKRGEKDPSQALDEAIADKTLSRARVSAFVKAVPGYGNAKTAKLMESLRIHDSRRLSGLGSRQVKALKEALAK